MTEFEPGEVAVLLNAIGGRLFTVHETKNGRVIERDTRLGQQPYAMDVHPSQLVKCPNIEAAHTLCETLGRIHTDFEQRAWKLNAERSRELAMAIKPFVDIQAPATPILCAGCMQPVNFDLVLGSECACSKGERSVA